MKEKVVKSQRTGLVMDCTDLVVLVFLFMVCGTTLVFAYGKSELNEHCQLYSDCNKIGYLCSGNRTCQCKSGYKPNEIWTKCVGFVGSKCFYDSHCIEGAYCTGLDGSEKCKCKEQDDFYVSEDGQTCTNSAVPKFHHGFHLSLLMALLCTSLYLNT